MFSKMSLSQINLHSLPGTRDYETFEGNCFVTHLEKESKHQDSIYLAIIPPEFEIETIHLILRERPKDKSKNVEYDTSTHIFVERPLAYEWVLQPKEINDNCSTMNIDIESQDLIFCLFEIPIRKTHFQIIKIKSSINSADIQRDTLKLIKYKKVSDGKLRVLTNKITGANYSIVAIPSGKWSDFSMVFCERIERQFLVLLIQQKLKERDYPIEITGKLDSMTRKALIDFQNKNCVCTSCRIPCDVLKILGIDKY